MSDESTTVLSNAERLLKGRLDAIGGLESAMTRLGEAQQLVVAREKEMSDAVSAAKSAGWTETELRQIGLPIGGARRSVRTSGKPRRSTRAASSASVDAPASEE